MKCTILALVLSFPAFASAQVSHASSLALHWTHVWGAPHFVGNIPSPESVYGVVDRLAYVSWLEYGSPAVVLAPGRYSASVRLKKHTSLAGRADLTLSVAAGAASLGTVTMPAAMQFLGQWVETPPLEFSVDAATGPLTFTLSNTNSSIQKESYDFDAFTVRAIRTHVLSCVSAFSYIHPNHFLDWPTTQSAFGVVKKVNSQNLTWLHAEAAPISLPSGSYVVRMRVRFTPQPVLNGGTSAPSDIRWRGWRDGVQMDSLMMSAASQPVGSWFDTTPFLLTVTQPWSVVRPAFGHTGLFKNGYEYDRMVITPAGTGAVSLVQNERPYGGSTISFDVFAPGADGQLAMTAWSMSTADIPLGNGHALPIAIDPLLYLSLTAGNGIFANNIGVLGTGGRPALPPTLTVPDAPGIAGLTVRAATIVLNLATLEVIGVSDPIAVTVY